MTPNTPPTEQSGPRTIEEAVRYFSDKNTCIQYLASRRWPDGVVRCPTCGSSSVRFLSTRQLWECKSRHANAQFSVRVGTIFEDSHIGLGQWLVAIWILANSNSRISSYEMARRLGITQKSAWFLLRRIEAALQTGIPELSKGSGTSGF